MPAVRARQRRRKFAHHLVARPAVERPVHRSRRARNPVDRRPVRPRLQIVPGRLAPRPRLRFALLVCTRLRRPEAPGSPAVAANPPRIDKLPFVPRLHSAGDRRRPDHHPARRQILLRKRPRVDVRHFGAALPRHMRRPDHRSERDLRDDHAADRQPRPQRTLFHRAHNQARARRHQKRHGQDPILPRPRRALPERQAQQHRGRHARQQHAVRAAPPVQEERHHARHPEPRPHQPQPAPRVRQSAEQLRPPTRPPRPTVLAHPAKIGGPRRRQLRAPCREDHRHRAREAQYHRPAPPFRLRLPDQPGRDGHAAHRARAAEPRQQPQQHTHRQPVAHRRIVRKAQRPPPARQQHRHRHGLRVAATEARPLDRHPREHKNRRRQHAGPRPAQTPRQPKNQQHRRARQNRRALRPDRDQQRPPTRPSHVAGEPRRVLRPQPPRLPRRQPSRAHPRPPCRPFRRWHGHTQ